MPNGSRPQAEQDDQADDPLRPGESRAVRVLGLHDRTKTSELVPLMGCGFRNVHIIGRASSTKDVELLVLQHEVAVLRRTNSRPHPGRVDQTWPSGRCLDDPADPTGADPGHRHQHRDHATSFALATADANGCARGTYPLNRPASSTGAWQSGHGASAISPALASNRSTSGGRAGLTTFQT